MKLSRLLKYQLAYAVAGISYNIVSLIMFYTSGRTLSTTSPYLGMTTLLVYAVCLLFGHFGYHAVYRTLMLVSIIGFGYAGIYLHLLNISSLHLYYSFTAWFLAVGINVAGLPLNILALAGKYSADRGAAPGRINH
jgi:hypothetical protein